MKQWHELEPDQRAEVRSYIRNELRFWKHEKKHGFSDFAPWFYDALKAALQRLKRVKRIKKSA